MNVYIKTFGCTLNQSDSDIMQENLKREGHNIVLKKEECDAIVVNTCTVKKPTEQRILHLLDSLHNEGKGIVVTGCLASASPEMVKKHAPLASVLSTANIHLVSQAVESSLQNVPIHANSRLGPNKLTSYSHAGGIIAHIPVSEGCISSCSFCETKFARPMLKSYNSEVILRAIKNSVNAGAKEIQLTSQDMGAYGMDKKTNIGLLMQQVSNIPGNFMVRVGMLNPDHLYRYIDEVIAGFNDDRFYKFVHLPMQSASRRVLIDMQRSCTAELFLSYVKELRAKVKGISIETDIIVGYPTEKEEDFRQTVDFIEEIMPDFTNISKFGIREHTRASKLKQLHPNIIKRRSTELYRIVRQIQNKNNQKLIGSNIDCLVTELTKKSINGRSMNYRQIVLNKLDGIELGDRRQVAVSHVSANALYCTAV